MSTFRTTFLYSTFVSQEAPQLLFQVVMLVHFIQVVTSSNLDRDINYPDLRIPFLSSLFSGNRWDIILRLLRDGICAETSFRPTVK